VDSFLGPPDWLRPPELRGQRANDRVNAWIATVEESPWYRHRTRDEQTAWINWKAAFFTEAIVQERVLTELAKRHIAAERSTRIQPTQQQQQLQQSTLTQPQPLHDVSRLCISEAVEALVQQLVSLELAKRSVVGVPAAAAAAGHTDVTRPLPSASSLSSPLGLAHESSADALQAAAADSLLLAATRAASSGRIHSGRS